MGDSKVFYCGKNTVFLVKCEHCGAIYAVQAEDADTAYSLILESNCNCRQSKTKDDWRYIKIGASKDNDILVDDRRIRW